MSDYNLGNGQNSTADLASQDPTLSSLGGVKPSMDPLQIKSRVDAVVKAYQEFMRVTDDIKNQQEDLFLTTLQKVEEQNKADLHKKIQAL